jgi:hypothetical protein
MLNRDVLYSNESLEGGVTLPRTWYSRTWRPTSLAILLVVSLYLLFTTPSRIASRLRKADGENLDSLAITVVTFDQKTQSGSRTITNSPDLDPPAERQP